ncbi:MAG: translation initiation factor IF-2 associated domain-containing protein, partial [Gallionellaceae bacterium]|nr:translation initiation factor IF-2 associated domain-containing protein [Gallionellaceae bacterium]
MNVEQFANELKVAPALLVEQLQAAGVSVSGTTDALSDQDKARLLDYLRDKHGAKAPKTKITLTRKQTSEIKTADSSGKARTIQVEVRKKRVLVKREAPVAAAEEVAPLEDAPIEIAETVPAETVPAEAMLAEAVPVEAVPVEVAESAPAEEMPVAEAPAVDEAPAPEPVAAAEEDAATEAAPIKPAAPVIGEHELKLRKAEAQRHAELRAIQEAELKAKRERE